MFCEGRENKMKRDEEKKDQILFSKVQVRAISEMLSRHRSEMNDLLAEIYEEMGIFEEVKLGKWALMEGLKGIVRQTKKSAVDGDK